MLNPRMKGAYWEGEVCDVLGEGVVPLSSEDARDDGRRICPFMDIEDGGRERSELDDILDMEEDGRRRWGGLTSRR